MIPDSHIPVILVRAQPLISSVSAADVADKVEQAAVGEFPLLEVREAEADPVRCVRARKTPALEALVGSEAREAWEVKEAMVVRERTVVLAVR